MSRILLIAALSYLLGSIPFGYVLVRVFRGEDVRQSGSGNIGATNVSRTSPVLGVVTLLLDALKGAAAVIIAGALSTTPAENPTTYLALAGFFAVAGHMFPVWLKFRGGKGVATGLGAFSLIAPKTIVLSIMVFIVVVAIFRYVSLGSVLAAASFPFFLAVGAFAQTNIAALILVSVTSLLIVVRHHENIRRIVSGTESRIGARRS
jgi:acyl phosphate:glycerol-3-phosphate acyltransferase